MNQQDERRRILVIDDDKPLLSVLNDFLIARGFNVVTAESGEEGLDRMEAFSPDIILLDVNMPGMGGIGFLRRIMSGSVMLKYPVIVFTARTTTRDFFRGIPVDGFIAKPCEEGELLRLIHETLKKHKRAAHGKILIGEDDVAVADRLLRVFREAGFEVEEAATGPEVLEKAVVCRPDAILMKRILTKMNGDAVTALLQAMPRTQSMPVVLYEASIVPDNRDEENRIMLAHGIRKCLATEDPVVLLNAVKGALGGC